MPTISKTYNFTTGADGFSLTYTTWDSTTQTLQTLAVGQNTRVDGIANLTSTYEAIGVPAGSEVSQIQIWVDHTCYAYNTAGSVYWNCVFDGAIVIPNINYTGVTAWATATSGPIPLAKVSSDSFTLLVDTYTNTLRSKTAQAGIRNDNVTLEVTYATPSLNANLESSAATAINNINYPSLSVGSSLKFSQALGSSYFATPSFKIFKESILNTPPLAANLILLSPKITLSGKIMTLDSLLNLFVLNELIEGEEVNLDKTGVLIVKEIVEGESFNLDSNGVLTVNTFNEGEL